jgi:hypothetical protein
MLRGRGMNVAQAATALAWPEIVSDAAGGELQPVYGRERRGQQELEAPVTVPPGRQDLNRYIIPMLGLHSQIVSAPTPCWR